jgi:hypothetical protein
MLAREALTIWKRKAVHRFVTSPAHAEHMVLGKERHQRGSLLGAEQGWGVTILGDAGDVGLYGRDGGWERHILLVAGCSAKHSCHACALLPVTTLEQ